MSNFVYIAQSLDGYIAKADGDIDWLNEFETINNEDFGYAEFIKSIDAIIMGRYTFEKVKSFETWPYKIPIYVLSNSIKEDNKLPQYSISSRSPKQLLKNLNKQGMKNFYIDGGKIIQSFLKLNLIDELIITTLPILLGDGIPLFDSSSRSVKLDLVKSKSYKNGFVQNHFKIIK